MLVRPCWKDAIHMGWKSLALCLDGGLKKSKCSPYIVCLTLLLNFINNDVCAAVAFSNDKNLHVCVRVQLVRVDNANEIDMLSIVMRINRCL